MNDTDPAAETWTGEYSIFCRAAPQRIWQFFRDVPGWKSWNNGIESIEIQGPFAVGAEFTMKPPGGEPLRSHLVEVVENERFVDETWVGDLVVRVTHAINPVDASHCQVTYGVQASGPGASQIGPAVSSDFPDVLDSLRNQVEQL